VQSDKVTSSPAISGRMCCWLAQAASIRNLPDQRQRAGPSQLAGELCSPYVFSTSAKNDQTPQAMGLYMNSKEASSRWF